MAFKSLALKASGILAFIAIFTFAAAACAPETTTESPVGNNQEQATATPPQTAHSDTDSSHQGDQPLLEDGAFQMSVTATDGSAWGYSPAVMEVSAGQRVALTLVNRGVIEHDIEFTGMPAERIQVATRQHEDTAVGHHSSQVVAAHAKVGQAITMMFTPTVPGTFEYLCTIPGHKKAGMVGRMVVQASARAQTTTG